MYSKVTAHMLTFITKCMTLGLLEVLGLHPTRLSQTALHDVQTWFCARHGKKGMAVY